MIYYHEIRAFLISLTFLSGISIAFSQSNISGVINTYTEVVSIDPASCHIRVSSTAGFSVGDRVMIIQMKGASLDTINDPSYGNITDYGNAGNYEFGNICDITGDSIKMNYALTRSYTTSGLVQLIRVPQYNNVTITGPLLAADWNGITGGVVVLEASGTVTLNADIDVRGNGFRRGLGNPTDATCLFGNGRTGYFYDSLSEHGGQKGEGIAHHTYTMRNGRGKWGNGGGGGNNHNSGGAGGSNFGAGGNGGQNLEPQTFGCKGLYPGIAASSLDYSSNRIFMGGGGGGGNRNNFDGPSDGADGSGIVIIKANAIEGNSHSIIATGITPADSYNDGAGGGGAGGTILLHTGSFGSTPLFLQARGGNGASAANDGSNRCFGPGGGGGGGVIYSNIALAANVSYNLSAGVSGITYFSSNACDGNTNNATSGEPGDTIIGLVLPEGVGLCTGCSVPLPVTLLSFDAKEKDRKVHLEWKVAQEKNLSHYEIERSSNGIQFSNILKVSADRSSTTSIKNYVIIDEEPFSGINYYRLRSVDKDGTVQYSQIVFVHISDILEAIKIYPNPVESGSEINIDFYSHESSGISLTLYNSFGAHVYQANIPAGKGYNNLNLRTDLAPGIYIVVLKTDERSFQYKLIVR